MSGPMAVDEERLEAAARNSAGEKRSRRSDLSKSTWLGGVRKDSLWLCYAGPLVEKQKSGILGKRRKPKPIPWKRNSWERKRASNKTKKKVYRFG